MIKSGAKKNPVMTGMIGGNSDLFAEVARLHISKGDLVWDATYGKGAFWNKTDRAQYQLITSDLTTPSNVQCDNLRPPFADKSFDCVIYDPPYLYNHSNTIKESIAQQYQNNALQRKTNRDVLDMYNEFAAVSLRLLKKSGILIVKCQDVIESNKQRWNHMLIKEETELIGFIMIDLFVLIIPQKPAIRWDHQHKARKNHSYFLVFQKTN
jgi:hypothetical protein